MYLELLITGEAINNWGGMTIFSSGERRAASVAKIGAARPRLSSWAWN